MTTPAAIRTVICHNCNATICGAILTATLGSAAVLSACNGGETTTASSVASVTLSPTNATITVGQHASFTATPRDAAGKALSDMTVTWTSSASTVAAVDAGGTVTGVAAGNAIVTAAVNSMSGSATIAVTAPTYDGQWTGTTAVGDTLTFTVARSEVLNPTFTIRLTGDCGIGGTTFHVNGAAGFVSGQQVTILSGGTDLNVSGTFSSFTAASGIGSYTLRGTAPGPVCTSTGSTTWTAQKQF